MVLWWVVKHFESYTTITCYLELLIWHENDTNDEQIHYMSKSMWTPGQSHPYLLFEHSVPDWILPLLLWGFMPFSNKKFSEVMHWCWASSPFQLKLWWNQMQKKKKKNTTQQERQFTEGARTSHVKDAHLLLLAVTLALCCFYLCELWHVNSQTLILWASRI